MLLSDLSRDKLQFTLEFNIQINKGVTRHYFEAFTIWQRYSTPGCFAFSMKTTELSPMKVYRFPHMI